MPNFETFGTWWFFTLKKRTFENEHALSLPNVAKFLKNGDDTML